MLLRNMRPVPLRPSQCAPSIHDKNTKLPKDDNAEVGCFCPQVRDGDSQYQNYRALRVLYFNYKMVKV
jgi:hypothetical protein